MAKLQINENPLGDIIDIDETGYPVTVERAARLWCARISEQLRCELVATLSPDATVLRIGGSIRELCENRIKLEKGNLVIQGYDVIVSPTHQNGEDYAVEILFAGVMKIWIKYTRDYETPPLSRLRTPRNVAQDTLYSSTRYPTDFREVAEGYENIQAVRMTSFRVRAESGLNFMSMEYK